MTYHERPKRADDIGHWVQGNIDREPSAIVMQGPPVEDDAFTLETLRLYRRFYPDCHLILSTWADTPRGVLAPIEDLGVDIVLSEKPPKAGLFNVNMQIVTASAGVERAVAKGASWILKTRVDQRMHNPYAMDSLQALAEAFPVRNQPAQQHRIIGVGQGSLTLAPYHVTDQTVFGHAKDMAVYWTPPLRLEDPPEHWPSERERVYLDVPIGELCRLGVPESYFASQFLQRLGRDLSWTLADTWAAYRDSFCFVDYPSVDLFWVKSQSYTQRELTSTYDLTNRYEPGFMHWLLLYSGKIQPADAEPYEPILKERFDYDKPLLHDRFIPV